MARVSLRAQQLFSLPSRQNQQQSTSPGAFAMSKSKKHSLQLARLTIAKLLKKRASDSLAILGKHSSGQAPNSKIGAAPTSSQIGEVFSNLAKLSKNRAMQRIEVANLIQASGTQQTQGKGVKHKKKALGANTRQILASMGLNLNHQQPLQPQLQSANPATASGLKRSQIQMCQGGPSRHLNTGKGATPTSKANRRIS